MNKKIKEAYKAYKDKSCNNKIKGYDQSKIQIEKTDEEDDENHTTGLAIQQNYMKKDDK